MALHHSSETHQQLIARIPEVTGRPLPQWFAALDEGPALLRFEERVGWLKAEHDLPHGYASALIHEFDRQRRSR